MCVGPWAWLPSTPHMCLLEELAPRQPELSRDKLRALLVCLFAGSFQSLSQITSHPCSAHPLASPFTLDGISTTFPSTACKTLNAFCTLPSPRLLPPRHSHPGEAGALLPQGLCTCCLFSQHRPLDVLTNSFIRTPMVC